MENALNLSPVFCSMWQSVTLYLYKRIYFPTYLYFPYVCIYSYIFIPYIFPIEYVFPTYVFPIYLRLISHLRLIKRATY